MRLAIIATPALLADQRPAAGALDGNSIDIAKAIGSVYGAGAEQAFLPLWRKHIGFVVDYTVGVATKDNARRTRPSMISSSTHRTSARFSLRRILICQKRRLPIS